MRKLLIAAAVALAACASPAGSSAPALTAQSANIVTALSDPRRPADGTARDAARHPAETLAFAGIRPGVRVGEILGGGGYFTRLFAVAAGEQGRVYPLVRPEGAAPEWETPVLLVAAQYPNAQVVRAAFGAMAFPEPLDVVFTAQNYHDLHIADYHFGDVAAINRAAFAALKPGGVYIVIDHAAIAGTPTQTADSGALHRIDQATVRREIEAAGFVFDGESNVLRNPSDPHTASVFDPSIRGHTDQFMMRFRKPG